MNSASMSFRFAAARENMREHLICSRVFLVNLFSLSSIIRSQEGDHIGLMRKASGALHFYINGIDQGETHHEL